LFGISTPLDEDESLNIQTSNLSIGIRGTVGIVKAVDDEHTTLTLLEGSVECETPDHQPVTVETGQTAEIAKKGDETCEVNVREIRAEDIEEFARTELDENDTLRNQVEEVLDYQSLPVTPNYENEKNYKALQMYRNELETNPEFNSSGLLYVTQFSLMDINQDGVYEMMVNTPWDYVQILFYLKDDHLERIECYKRSDFWFTDGNTFTIETLGQEFYDLDFYQFDGAEPELIDQYEMDDKEFWRVIDTMNDQNEVFIDSGGRYSESAFKEDIETYKKRIQYVEKPRWEYEYTEINDWSLDEYFSGAGKASEIVNYSPGEKLEELPEISRIIVQ
jgi:hypothetical protein